MSIQNSQMERAEMFAVKKVESSASTGKRLHSLIMTCLRSNRNSSLSVIIHLIEWILPLQKHFDYAQFVVLYGHMKGVQAV